MNVTLELQIYLSPTELLLAHARAVNMGFVLMIETCRSEQEEMISCCKLQIAASLVVGQ